MENWSLTSCEVTDSTRPSKQQSLPLSLKAFVANFGLCQVPSKDPRELNVVHDIFVCICRNLGILGIAGVCLVSCDC